jgi:hypothetical protein
LTFAGAFNIQIATLTSATITVTRLWTLVASQTLTVTTTILLAGIAGGRPKFLSSSPGTKAILTLAQGISASIYLIDATDIDSSAGVVVVSPGGTISTSLNWYSFYPNPGNAARGSALVVSSAGMY